MKPHSHPDERPDCPRCGSHGARINKDGFYRGTQRWRCFNCLKTFLDPGVVKELRKPDVCPRCGGTNLEEEPDGTLLCWSCDWFQRNH